MKALLDRTAEDAAVVARVRSADAIVWGKTNTPVKAADWQTYNSLYGTTNNPWDLTRTPGGSSADRRQRLQPASRRWRLGLISAVRCACRQVFVAFSLTSRPMD